MPHYITFSDLTHTGQTVCANTFPLGAAMVGAYAKKQLQAEIDVEIFKYPEDLASKVEKRAPKIAAFSAYSWNNNLGHEFARRIKARHPETVIVFGGENFPGYGGISSAWASEARLSYLKIYPSIDFYIFGEAELAFVELYRRLAEVNFDVAAFKSARTKSSNVFYTVDGELVSGPIMPRIMELDEVPSTFDDGLCDKFFDGVLTPMVETARGCPFSCTFCNDGHLYSSKTRRFSQERVKYELEYIAQRAKVNELIITDLNFGMFKEDVDTSLFLAGLQDQYDFPRYLVQASAKNHKERIIEISKILRGALAPGASVQSTAPAVLQAIKRKNLTLEELIEVSKTRESDDASSLSEIIMCLPEDTREHHFNSIFDMVDAGVTLLRNHQFMLLKGTEAEGAPSRKRYELQTRFRVQPRCFGLYSLWGEEFSAVEIEEICVAQRCMSYEDYQACRDLNLTVEIFLNDAIFYDLFRLLDLHNVRRSDFLRRVHEAAVGAEGNPKIKELYSAYRAEEKTNLWQTREELAAFTSDSQVISEYISGKRGSNEIYKYRALAVFRHMKELHDVVYGVAETLLADVLATDEKLSLYFRELREFSQLRKQEFLDHAFSASRSFHFDFVELAERNFAGDPLKLYRAEGVDMDIFHTGRQRTMIEEWIQQHGTSINGLGRLLSRAQVSAMYRRVGYANGEIAFKPKWAFEARELEGEQSRLAMQGD